jgi:CubicO group peptidase (beta-lactamase class C family)
VPAALCALRLTEQGKLSLDEDVNNQLKSWHIPENEFTRDEKVTVRRILCHSAGLTVHGFPGYPRAAPLPKLTDILDGTGGANTSPVRVESIPGNRWKYSGGGYTILQELMTDVTGTPFPDLMRETILEPLGMRRSTFAQPLPIDWQSDAAYGHTIKGAKIRGSWQVYPEMAAAGLWTTPSDLARLILALQQAIAGREDGVISPTIARWMTTPAIDKTGLGLALSGPRNNLFGHDGRNRGFDSILLAASSRGVVIMVNANNNAGSLNRICDAAWFSRPGAR